jgi:hypothetical protein
MLHKRALSEPCHLKEYPNPYMEHKSVHKTMADWMYIIVVMET